MEQAGWKNGLVQVSKWILRMAWINILWIAFTLVGLGIAGFLPATAAMFAVLRRWIKGDLENSLFQNFWSFYKKEFLKVNAAGFLLLVAGYILYIDLFVYQFGTGGEQQVLQVILYIIAFFYMLTAVFFFPVYVHYDLKWFQYMKYSILTAFSYPFRAIAMLAISYGLLYLVSNYPGAILFFLGSCTAYIWLLMALPLFEELSSGQSSSNFYKKEV